MGIARASSNLVRVDPSACAHTHPAGFVQSYFFFIFIFF